MFLLCGHAAQHPPHVGLVGAALDMLAARLNYPSRPSLMLVHAQTLIFDWCSHDLSLQHFIAIQVSRLVALCDPPTCCCPVHGMVIRPLGHRLSARRQDACLHLLQSWMCSLKLCGHPVSQIHDQAVQSEMSLLWFHCMVMALASQASIQTHSPARWFTTTAQQSLAGTMQAQPRIKSLVRAM